MRIIGGIYKGRTVKFPKSKLVRPTTDKTKESLFNYLVHSLDFENFHVCDLYAGSGSLGLEALSRGASKIDFVEKDFNVVKVLLENISSLQAAEQCYIYRTEALKFSRMKEHPKYNLILADPPFYKYDIHSVVENLLSNNFLFENGVLIVERSVQTKEIDQEKFGCKPFKKIGDSLIYKFDS
jgi:16S rRNA (guanine966-N2)-methyltransferase